MSLTQKASLLKCEKHNREIIYLSLAPDEVLQKRTLCDLCLRYSQQPTDITQIEELLRVLRLSTLTDFNQLKSSILKHLDQLEALIRLQLQNISQSLVPSTVIEHYLTNQNQLELLDFQKLAELLSKICDYDGYQHQIKQQSYKVYQQIRIINKKLAFISQELIVLDEYFQLDQPIYAYRTQNETEVQKEQVKQSNINNNNKNNNNKCQLKLQNQMQDHSSNIKFVYLNDQELISSSMDKQIKIWNIKTNTCIQTLPLQTITNCLSLNLIGNIMVTGSEDKMVRVWIRNKEFEWKQSQQEHQKPIISILFNRLQDNQFVSGGQDGKIIIWVQHTDNLYKVKQVLKASNEITCLQFNRDYTLLAAGTRGRNIVMWQAVSKDWIFRQNLDEGFVIRSISFNNQSNLLASAYADKTIRLWREDKEKHYNCFQQLCGHFDYIWVIKFDFERDLLFSAGKDKKIIIWKADQNDLWVQDNIIEEESGVQTMSIQNQVIAVGLESKNIKLYAIS